MPGGGEAGRIRQPLIGVVVAKRDDNADNVCRGHGAVFEQLRHRSGPLVALPVAQQAATRPGHHGDVDTEAISNERGPGLTDILGVGRERTVRPGGLTGLVVDDVAANAETRGP